MIDRSEALATVIAVIILMSGLCCVLYIAGEREGTEEMQKQCIERGFAEYDSITGKWKFKEAVK